MEVQVGSRIHLVAQFIDLMRFTALPAAKATTKPNTFDVTFQTLNSAFSARSVGKLFRDPAEDENLPKERVFIVSWVDYCNKYGMGYALTDGSVGVHFNDTTTLILSPDKKCVSQSSFGIDPSKPRVIVTLITSRRAVLERCTCANRTLLPHIRTSSRPKCIS